MAREAKQEYRYHEDGAIALYRRPNSAMWYARCNRNMSVNNASALGCTGEAQTAATSDAR